jgi:hypothetical protein
MFSLYLTILFWVSIASYAIRWLESEYWCWPTFSHCTLEFFFLSYWQSLAFGLLMIWISPPFKSSAHILLTIGCPSELCAHTSTIFHHYMVHDLVGWLCLFWWPLVWKSQRLSYGKAETASYWMQVVMCRWQPTEPSNSVSNTNGQQNLGGCVRSSGIIYLTLTNIETKGTDLICQLQRACSCILIHDLSS